MSHSFQTASTEFTRTAAEQLALTVGANGRINGRRSLHGAFASMKVRTTQCQSGFAVLLQTSRIFLRL